MNERENSWNIATADRVRILAVCLLLSAGISMVGCQHHFTQSCGEFVELADSPNLFTNQQHPFQKLNRVVIVTTKSEGSYQLQTQFAKRLAEHLNASNKVFAVVHDRPCLTIPLDVIRTGKYDPAQLVKLGKTYSADAVIYAEVNSFRGYHPMEATTSVIMVDVNESIIRTSGTVRRSTADHRVMNSYQQFAAGQFEGGGELVSRSPTTFIGYLAYDIAWALNHQFY